MDRLKKKSSRGMSTLLFLLIISTVLYIGQAFIFMDQQIAYLYMLDTQNIEGRNALLESLETLLAEELAVRNSRFNSNSKFYQCLYGVPTPCDETVSYDMILYSPNPPVAYAGGAWPPPPAGISVLAGGLTLNPIFYNRSAGICFGVNYTKPNTACPLQAIIQFKPICGGTISSPAPLATPGVCPGPATGFDITIGVGVDWRGTLKYKGDTSATGDARIYRIKSNSLVN